MKRLLPAIGLFFLAPLVAEFLLGNIPITMLGSLIVLAPMYGGGALLVREFVRRSGRGWPTVILLGLAFGILEEAFMTQSLFNSNYLGLNLHLLEPAYMPSLGIGAWWTVFVLTLHTVWSISVSIALTESLVPDRATTPWLGRLGLCVVGLLFALAAVSITSFSIKQDAAHFVASTAQFVSAGIICAAVVVVAFLLPKPSGAHSDGNVPSPWLIGLIGLVAGSILLVVPNRFAWWAVLIYLVLDAIVVAAIYVWSSRRGWNGSHRLALAGGAALAYAWHAFIENPAVGHAGRINRIGNAVFALGLVILLYFAVRKMRTPADSQPATSLTPERDTQPV
jgi:hypothetical protein